MDICNISLKKISRPCFFQQLICKCTHKIGQWFVTPHDITREKWAKDNFHGWKEIDIDENLMEYHFIGLANKEVACV